MHNRFKYKIVQTIIFLVLVYFTTLNGFAQEQGDGQVTDTVVTSTEENVAVFDRMQDTTHFETRTVPDSIVRKMRDDEDYWYVNTAPARVKKKEPSTQQNDHWYEKDWFSKLLWFLVIAIFVTILIWFLASSNIGLFRKRQQSKNGDAEEMIEENIFSLDFEKEIREAVEEKAYRLAVRLWYLRTLKELAERNIIQYKHESTNSVYVSQLYSTRYHKGFFRLTRSFEYIWYGKLEVTADAYAVLEKDFISFKQQLQ